MRQPESFFSRLDQLLSRLLSGLWRGVFAVLGMAVVLALLVLGFVLSLVLIVWALLRGRRPGPVHFRWSRRSQGMPGPGPRAPQQTAQSAADVVDVEVREIPQSAAPERRVDRP